MATRLTMRNCKACFQHVGWCVLFRMLLLPTKSVSALTRALHAKSLPNPLTREDCEICDQNVTDLLNGKSACINLIDLLRTGSADVVSAHRISRDTNVHQQDNLDAEVSDALTDLAKARVKQDMYREARLSAANDLVGNIALMTTRAAGTYCNIDQLECNWQCYLDRYPDLSSSFGETNTAQSQVHYETVGETEGRDCFCQADLVDPWLLCDARRRQAELDLQACYERIQSEKVRLAARERQYEAAANSSAATRTEAQAEKDILERTLQQVKASSESAQSHITQINAHA